MKRLVFATNNAHKLQEVRELLQQHCSILSLKDVGLHADIPETADTLQGNARQKVDFVLAHCQALNNANSSLVVDGVFADDTGLEVDALGGAPGVYSARYAGEHCSFDDNINKLLAEMKDATDRHARFRTVICLIENGQVHYFEGKVDGVILTERHGQEGFGYDPVFMPDRFAVSFAEMPLEVKNMISHRGLAVKKLVEHLKKVNGEW